MHDQSWDKQLRAEMIEYLGDSGTEFDTGRSYKKVDSETKASDMPLQKDSLEDVLKEDIKEYDMAKPYRVIIKARISSD